MERLNPQTNNQNDSMRIHIEMVEISKETRGASLLIPSPIKCHEIIKTAVEEELIRQNLLKFKFQSFEVPGNVSVNIHCQDARKVVTRFLNEVHSRNGSKRSLSNGSHVEGVYEEGSLNIMENPMESTMLFFLIPSSPEISRTLQCGVF